jgi:hypothetical protein
MLSRLNRNIFWTKTARISVFEVSVSIETKFFTALKIAWHYIFVKKPCGFYKITIKPIVSATIIVLAG